MGECVNVLLGQTKGEAMRCACVCATQRSVALLMVTAITTTISIEHRGHTQQTTTRVRSHLPQYIIKRIGSNWPVGVEPSTVCLVTK